MKSKLKLLMTESLPGITKQKKRKFKTTQKEVIELYHILNKQIFDNKLILPEIIVKSRCRQYWGMCHSITWKPIAGKVNVKIILSDKWYCKQWLIMTLAHEMCHQYQWDIIGPERVKAGKSPIMSHGPSFFIHRDRLEKFDIPLKRAHGTKRWFQHQNLFKC